MKARELMTEPMVTVRRETSLAEVAKIMVDRRIGGVAVVDEEGKLRGMVTLTDFAAKERGVPFSLEDLPRMYSPLSPRAARARVHDEARATTAQEVMITEVITACEDTPLEEVAQQMLRHDIDHIPVVRDGVPVGMVSRHDFLRMIARSAEPEGAARAV
jgi:CBS domain-containing protein